MRKHVLASTSSMLRAMKRGVQHAEASGAVAGKLDYPASAAGGTAHVKLMVADSLGAAGKGLADKVLKFVESDFSSVQSTFNVALPSWTVVIAPLSGGNDGSGGAYHYGCSSTTFYVDADERDDGSTTAALIVAEGVEVAEATGGKRWDCGASPGEALSRTLAELSHPGVLDGYETASAWLDRHRKDWVTKSDATDQNAESTGCGVLFLYWLLTEKYTWPQIAQANGATLAQTYKALTGKDTAWTDFSAAVNARWPHGKPSGVTTDNPW